MSERDKHGLVDIRFDPKQRRMSGIARAGHTPFNVPFISQITDTLWTGGCENGMVLPEEIVHVVSLYPWESYKYHEGVRTVLSVKAYDDDGGVNAWLINNVADWVTKAMADGPTLVHCQAGLNRSNLVATRALVISGQYTTKEAIALLREKRSPAVLCNVSFEEWLESLE